MIGEGRIHGEDDAIGERAYKSSLICNVADSELLIMTRVEFERMFKSTTECWNNAVKYA